MKVQSYRTKIINLILYQEVHKNCNNRKLKLKMNKLLIQTKQIFINNQIQNLLYNNNLCNN
jgi:hypothetical protein